jgi:tetratricopeptide (TPR) repeat protein
MSMKRLPAVTILTALLATPLSGCAAAAPSVTPPAPPVVRTQEQIITPSEATTESDLVRRGEYAMLRQKYQEAVDAYATLVAASRDGPRADEYLLDLAMAYEGLEDREKARALYRDLAARFPDRPNARAALARTATLDAYLEDWKDLGDIGDRLLARADLDDEDRIAGLGARGLSKVELGDDLAASRDVHDGLDLADRIHYGSPNVLPVAAAQLRFALGEVRRARAERITFDPLPPDFLAKLEERCTLLLQAQDAYAEAVKSVDPHWAAMAGFRVGQMYRALHHDLMLIPPPAQSKTERQKQIFYAFMHVRYRVLLEKGLRQLDQTVALGERTNDSSTWIKRAEAAREEMQVALADEKAQIAKYPFTEAEIEEALNQLAKKVEASKRPSAQGGAPPPIQKPRQAQNP